ncbi:MAG: TonB-dependent receptor [Candidatus Latescibacteria bacterium]|nr:TonB-dependent receptor [Candidatus Latescibacterota bacterium]
MSRRIRRNLLLQLVFVCLSSIRGIGQEWELREESALDSLLAIPVSTAAKYAQSASQAPASVTLITADDIARYGYHTLEEVFAAVRGFYVSNDRNYSYIGARGFGRPTDYNNRVLLLIDGHSFNENFYGSASTGTELALDLSSIERLEIVRGPGAALYGTGAMLAVVNVITKSGRTTDGLRVDAEAGQFGNRRGELNFGREFASGLDLAVSGLWMDSEGPDLFYPEYDDPATNAGRAVGLDWDRAHGGYVRLGFAGLTLQGFHSSREKGIPTGAFGIAFGDPRAQTLDEQSFIDLKGERQLPHHQSLRLRGYFDHYRYRGTYPYDEEDYHTLLFDANDGQWLGGEAQFTWDLRSDNRMVAGVEYQKHLQARYHTWDLETDFFDGDYPFTVFSFYLEDEYQVSRDLSLTLGWRRDRYAGAKSSASPRGALIYKPRPSSTFKLLYGEAYRAPNMYELHYESPGDAKGNPSLGPEEIRTGEVVWEQRLTQRLWGLVSLYDYQMRALLEQRLDPADSLRQFHNTDKVQARGAELECRGTLWAGATGYASYVLQRAEDKATATELTNSPGQSAKVGVAGPLAGLLHTAVEVQYEAGRRTLTGSRTDPYLLTKARLAIQGWSPGAPKGKRVPRLGLSLTVYNLFDASYAVPGGFEHRQDAIPQDGRRFVCRLNCEF